MVLTACGCALKERFSVLNDAKEGSGHGFFANEGFRCSVIKREGLFGSVKWT